MLNTLSTTAGSPDPQGWTSVDLTEEGVHFHVDGSSGGMNSSGCLVPLQGDQSLWCGSPFPSCAGWDPPGGYGNFWYDVFASDTFLVQGDVTVSYLVSYDTEPGYDYAYLEYWNFTGSGTTGPWVTVKEYDNKYCRGTETVTIPAAEVGDSLWLRFVFQSDGTYSDEDCFLTRFFATEGAIIIDSLTVSDATGVIDFQDFESETIGDLATADGDWQAVPVYYGDYAALHSGANVLQEDPCVSNLTHFWGFFDDPAHTSYACGGHAEQGAVPYMKNAPHYEAFIRNEVRSPAIPFSGSGCDVILSFDVYMDSDGPLYSCVFFEWHVRSFWGGAWQEWEDRGYIYYSKYSKDKRWQTVSERVGDLVSVADSIQVALGVWDVSGLDLCLYGSCHSHYPLFDNVRVLRVDWNGPVWSVEDCDLFQDNFAEDGTVTGTVRVDRALSEGGVPGDSTVVTVYECSVGLDADPWDGRPAVYLHVRNIPPSKSGAVISGDPVRWPVVATGPEWTVVLFDEYSSWSNMFSVDLNDHLYTPGDTVFFYFSARDALGRTTYWSRFTGATTSESEVRAAPMEMTCLPANALSGGTDILYIDGSDHEGAQSYFDEAFDSLGVIPDRFDVPHPYWDGPASRVVDVAQQIIPYYRTVIWNLSDASEEIGCTEDCDDYGLLYDFLDQRTDTAGIYFSGDNLAGFWDYRAPFGGSAADLRSHYMNFGLLSDNHVEFGLPPSPEVIGQPASIFDDGGAVDSLVAEGACPYAAFDVLAWAGESSVAAAYLGALDYGAVLAQETPTTGGGLARTVLSGFSYHRIRDVEGSPGTPPAHVAHLDRILDWIREGGEFGPICQIEPDTLDFGAVLLGDSSESVFSVVNAGGDTLRGTVSEACAPYSIVAGEGVFALAHNETLTVTVRFEPTVAGSLMCDIETGTESCGGVHATGFGQTPRLHVDQDADVGGDGSSWAKAYIELYDALSIAHLYPGIDEIWVADGTYKPTAGTDRTASFELRRGLSVYGGFAGDESSLDERDVETYVAILSGDIGAPGDSTDNCYHVVSADSVNDVNATLDGFTITRGNANGTGYYQEQGGGVLLLNKSNLTLANLIFTHNHAANGGGGLTAAWSHPVVRDVKFLNNSSDIYSGGMHIGRSWLTLKNAFFSGNTATARGGAIFNYIADPWLINVVFFDNSAGLDGGGLYNHLSHPNLVNVTFCGNTAVNQGGGMCSSDQSSATIINTIMWGDSADTGDEIFNEGATLPTISYSLIAGSGGSGGWNPAFGIDGGNNIDADPLFVDAPGGNLRLQGSSPAVEAGDSTAANLPDADLDGNPRIQGLTVDMGAYEEEGGVTAVEEDIPPVPSSYALYQNYPNPFNPTTAIQYDVPESGGHVTLRIYDVSGRLVRTLVDSPQTAGAKRVTWNGRNDQGNRVATGVYFYRMTAPNFQMTKKMVLLQ